MLLENDRARIWTQSGSWLCIIVDFDSEKVNKLLFL